jgi:hypothetical protein
LNDYKGKRRRKNKQKKLDKLIIRNISSLSQMVSTAPPNATNICSTILDKTIKNLPCFQKSKSKLSDPNAPLQIKNRNPVIIKIRKDKLQTSNQDSNPSTQKSVKAKNSNKSDHEKKIEKERMLRKQLNIDMVKNGNIFTTNVLLGRRKAKSEARKALVKPSTKAKNKAENKGQIDLKNEQESFEDEDEEVVESILDKIMGGDDTSNSSLDDVIKPPDNNQIKPDIVVKDVTDEPIAEAIGKLVQDEVTKEMRRSSSPRLVYIANVRINIGLNQSSYQNKCQ